MKNIVYIINSSLLSGVEKRFLNIIKYSTEHRKTEICLILNKDLYEIVKDHNIYKSVINDVEELIVIPFQSGNRTYKTLIRFYYLIKNIKILKTFNNVHLILDYYTVLIFKILNINSVFEISSPEVVDRCTKWYKKPLLKYFDVLSCVSPSVYKRLSSKYSGNNIQEAPIPFYSLLDISEQIIKNKNNIIVYGSRFIKRKNPILFSKVLNLILNKHKEWNAYVLGGGELESEVVNILFDHIKTKRVIIGRVPNFIDVLKLSKLYVSLIEPDNYPSQSILEAMNTYNYLILSNNGETHKFLNETNGELVNIDEQSVFIGIDNAIKKIENNNYNYLSSLDYLKYKFSPNIYFNYLDNLYINK